MKRMHIHLGVADIDQSIAFYSSLFGTDPDKVKPGYARSDKSWVRDPDGIAWEAYQTMANAELFSQSGDESDAACCTPETKGRPACCTPTQSIGGCCA